MDQTLKFVITASAPAIAVFRSVQNGLQALERGAQSVGRVFGTLTSVFSTVGSAIGGVITTLGTLAAVLAGTVAAALTGFIALMVKSAEAAGEEEAAYQRAAISFRSFGNSFPQEEIAAFAAQMQQLTGVADDQVAGFVGLLGTFNLTKEQAKALTPAILDAAEALKAQGATVEGLAVAIGKALQTGNVGALKRMGIVIDDADVKRLGLFQAVLQGVAKEGAGAAVAFRATLPGALQALKNNIGDVQEAIGGPLTEALRQLADLASQVLTSPAFQGAIKSFGEWVASIATKENVVAILTNIAAAVKTIWDQVSGFISSVGGEAGIGSIWEAFGKAAESALNLAMKLWGGFTAGVQFFAENSDVLWQAIRKGIDFVIAGVEVLVGALSILIGAKMIAGLAGLSGLLGRVATVLGVTGAGGAMVPAAPGAGGGTGIPAAGMIKAPSGIGNQLVDWVGGLFGGGRPPPTGGTTAGGPQPKGVEFGGILGGAQAIGRGILGTAGGLGQSAIGAMPPELRDFGKRAWDAISKGAEAAPQMIRGQFQRNQQMIGGFLGGLGPGIPKGAPVGGGVGGTGQGMGPGGAGAEEAEKALKQAFAMREQFWDAMQQQAKAMADAAPEGQRDAEAVAKMVPVLVAHQQELAEWAKRFGSGSEEYWKLSEQYWKIQAEIQNLGQAATKEQQDAAKRAADEMKKAMAEAEKRDKEVWDAVGKGYEGLQNVLGTAVDLAKGQLERQTALGDKGMIDEARQILLDALIEQYAGLMKAAPGEDEAGYLKRHLEAERVYGQTVEALGIKESKGGMSLEALFKVLATGGPALRRGGLGAAQELLASLGADAFKMQQARTPEQEAVLGQLNMMARGEQRSYMDAARGMSTRAPGYQPDFNQIVIQLPPGATPEQIARTVQEQLDRQLFDQFRGTAAR